MANSTIKSTMNAPIEVTSSMCNNCTPTGSYYVKNGRICNLNALLTTNNSISAGSAIITSPPNGFVPMGRVNFMMRFGGDWHIGYINTTGQVACNDNIPNGSTVIINVTYASYN